MPQDIVSGLFGLSPMQVQQQQDAAIESAANQYAQQDPFARASSSLYRAGAGLGRIGAGMLGMVNPQVQQAQQMSAAAQGVDTSTPEGLIEFANKIQNFDPNRALQARLQAKKMQDEAKLQDATIALKNAQANRANRLPAADEYEYESMMGVVSDPNSSAEQIQFARDRIAALNAKAARGGSSGGTGRAIKFDAAGGTYWLDPYTKKVTTLGGRELSASDAEKLVAASNDPTLRESLARSESGGKEIGKIAASAMAQLPRVEVDLSTIQKLGTKLFNHPGYSQLVGAGFPGLKNLAGSGVPGADALYKQIVGIGGLMAREDLRGQGQVTEAEAKAALEAYNSMNTTMNEADFRDAYKEFVKRVQNVRDILRTKSGATFNQAPFQAPTAIVNTNASSGYFGGDKNVAVAEQIRMMQAELTNPNIQDADKAVIRREIARLSGNKSVAAQNTRKTKSGIIYTMEP